MIHSDMAMPNNLKIDEEKYKSILKYIKLNVTDKYDFPQEIVQIDGITIATLGNFSASTGKPKSKKTFNVSAIVASALSGKEVLKYKANLPACKNRFFTLIPSKANVTAIRYCTEYYLLPDCLPTKKMTGLSSSFFVNIPLTNAGI